MTPDPYTIQETFLEVGDGHTLYIHHWGKKSSGVPIIYLHGGPGSKVSDRAKELFDPLRQEIIFFDQRGCGKSLPSGSLEHNTTDDLIEDIKKIADHLDLKKFIIVGGSWGSCLALAYALKYPERVAAMVLHGIFTGSSAETAWLDRGLFRTFLPDVWQKYLDATPATHRSDPSTYHFKTMLGDDKAAAKQSAYAYANLESAACFMDDRVTPEPFEDFDADSMRIEVHYLSHGCFMPDNYILDNAHKLAIPMWLVQGRFDMVCPPQTAYTLSRKAPHAELLWTISGHKPERETWNVMRTILLQLTNG